jgi:hypothetical protein
MQRRIWIWTFSADGVDCSDFNSVERSRYLTSEALDPRMSRIKETFAGHVFGMRLNTPQGSRRRAAT